MCKDYLINPIPSVASWLRESKGTELKLEFCADQVNDGQLFAVALGLWNLIDLDTLCVAYASAVTDVVTEKPHDKAESNNEQEWK